MAGYGDDAGFTAYAATNGYTVPDGSIPAARNRGSMYIDGVYGYWFPGSPTGGSEQEREWPRTGAEDIYGNAIGPILVPTRVIYASYEAALLELKSPGSLSVVTSEVNRLRSVKAGSVEVEFADSSAVRAIDGAVPMSTIIEGLLRPFIGLSPEAVPNVLVV